MEQQEPKRYVCKLPAALESNPPAHRPEPNRSFCIFDFCCLHVQCLPLEDLVSCVINVCRTSCTSHLVTLYMEVVFILELLLVFSCGTSGHTEYPLLAFALL